MTGDPRAAGLAGPRDRAGRGASLLAAAAIVVSLLAIADLLFALLGLTGLLAGELLLVLVPAVLLASACDEGLGRTLRLAPAAPSALAGGAMAGAAAWLLSPGVLDLQDRLVPLTAAEAAGWRTLEAELAGAPVLGLVAMVIAPAVAEEALFRGLVLRRIERRWGAGAAVGASALLFALFHRSARRLVLQGLVGFLAGVFAVGSGSLLPAVLLHLTYNGCVLATRSLAGLAPGPAAAAGLGAAAAGLGLLAVSRRGRGGRPTAWGAPAAFAVLALPLAVGGCANDPSPGRGTLVVAIESAPRDLDPRWALDAVSQRLGQLVHASLLRIGPAGDLEPDLATSVEAPDPCTWIVRIRADARFHDGRPLRARDVRATFDGLASGAVRSPRRRSFEAVETVEAPDDETVVFRTREPFPSLPVNLVLGILPEGSPADTGLGDVGAGPYRLAAIDPGEVVLERHEAYHGGVAPVGRIRFRVLPDATTRALELRKGSVDLVLNGLPPDALRPLASVPHLSVATAPGSTYWYVGLNLRDPVLAKREVREAVARSIDRDALVAHLLQGYARKASGPLAPGNPFFVADLESYERDVGRARSLLDAAGYPDPDGDGPLPRLRLALRTSTDDTARLQALAIADMVREAGIDLEVRSYEFATFFQDVVEGRFQLFTLRLVGLTDPDWFDNAFHSQAVPPAGLNRGRYASPRVDRLLEAARHEMDGDLRYREYADVQRLVARELPLVSLYHASNVAVISRRVEGVELWSGGDFTPLARARLVDDVPARP